MYSYKNIIAIIYCNNKINNILFLQKFIFSNYYTILYYKIIFSYFKLQYTGCSIIFFIVEQSESKLFIAEIILIKNKEEQ